MINDICDARPLESFFPSLAALPSVQTALREKFGKDASAIIAKMKAGESLSDEELVAHDIIHDLVHNNSIAADSLEGWSSASDDTFPINVMQFESVFWIEAPEFDHIGYFDTLEEARDAAEFNYEPLITEALTQGLAARTYIRDAFRCRPTRIGSGLRFRLVIPMTHHFTRKRSAPSPHRKTNAWWLHTKQLSVRGAGVAEPLRSPYRSPCTSPRGVCPVNG